jgi:hypothetical protein
MLPPMAKDPELDDSEPDSDRDDDDADEDREERGLGAEATSSPAKRTRKRKRSAATHSPRTKRQSKPKRQLPRTEQEIDSPKPLTLWLLGVMSVGTLVMWGTARFACTNQGGVAKQPPDLPTQDLARTPKDAAIEMQQRLASYNFAGAIQLSKGAVVGELKQEQQRLCGSDQECQRKQAELSSEIQTTGATLSMDGSSAVVRVSTIAPSGTQSYLLKLEPEGKLWKVTERRPDSGKKSGSQ